VKLIISSGHIDQSTTQARNGLNGAIIFAIVALAILVGETRLAERVNGLWFDSRTAVLRTWLPENLPDDVRLVAFDDATLRKWPEPLALWHFHLAELLKAVKDAKPKLVIVDIAFPSKSMERYQAGGDIALAKAIAELRMEAPIILGISANNEGRFVSPLPLFLASAGAQSNGYILWLKDADGVVRRFTEALGEKNERVPTLSGVALRQLGIEPRPGFVDYSRGQLFSYIPMQTMTDSVDTDSKQTQWRGLHGKIVVIGSVLPYEDAVPQAANLAGWPTAGTTPGLLLHAQTIRSHLGDTMIKILPSWVGYLLAVACCFAWLARTRLKTALWISAGILVALVVVSFTGMRMGWELNWIAAFFGCCLTAAVIILMALRKNILEKLRVKQIFGGYVSPRILDSILAGKLDARLAKQRQELCFMFADIRGFTAYSKITSPEATIVLLNRYLSPMTKVIHRHGGTVDKYRGDGIMAFFGAPSLSCNPSRDGLLAGVEMLSELELLNEELLKEGQVPIKIGIGLAFGEAVVGNIGSDSRHDYTAIGDAVNMAAHIQEYSKKVPYDLLCTKDVRLLAGDITNCRINIESIGTHVLAKHGPIELCGYSHKIQGIT